MITGLEHIAVAVSDLDEGIKRLLEDFQLSYEGVEDVEEAMTSTAFFKLSTPTSIELIHPLRDGGPVKKYLEKNGRGGLHHLCFTTDDIEADIERLRGKGYQFLSETHQPGAHGCRVIFIHPKSCDGVLVELSQPPAA